MSDPSGPDGVADGSPWYADAPKCCEACGEEIDGPYNHEAWDYTGEYYCDECAEQVIEDNGQFGVGA